MKKFNRIFIISFIVIALIFAAANLLISCTEITETSKEYLVEISRISDCIENDKDYSLENMRFVTSVKKIDSTNDLEVSKNYAVRNINGQDYRFEYNVATNHKRTAIFVNIILTVIAVFIFAMLFFIRQKILIPFSRFSNVPYELSKGNLTAPLTENKSRYFGKFVWGVNVLRENIELQHEKELELQKEKQTLILSISHDIKTPLSAIKLYSRALSGGLYKDTEKQRVTAESINKSADEIEHYVSELVKTASEDFLCLDVQNSEYYFSDVISKISSFYIEKLNSLKIGFSVDNYSNCLIKGDADRTIEVLQNVIENAIKYGDGHSIEISFSDEEDCRLVTIKNSGCTLSENELPHIFDSFWRGSNVGSNNGSGLGLYICRQLMLKMDGEIFAEITPPFISITAVLRKV